VLVLDALTYAGNLDNICPGGLEQPALLLSGTGSVLDRTVVEKLVAQSDAVVHFAAETHVDNSIHNYNTDEFNRHRR